MIPTVTAQTPSALRSHNLMPTWRALLRCPTSFDDHAAVQRTLASNPIPTYESEPVAGRYAVDLRTQADVRRFSYALAENYGEIIGRPVLPDGHTVGRWAAVALSGTAMLTLAAKAALQARHTKAVEKEAVKPAARPSNILARFAAVGKGAGLFFKSVVQAYASARAPSKLPNLLEMVSFMVEDMGRADGTITNFSTEAMTPVNTMLLSAADATLTPAQVRRRITLGLLRQSGELFAMVFFNRPSEHLTSKSALCLDTHKKDGDELSLQMRSAKIAGQNG